MGYARPKHLLDKYGITPEGYGARLLEQGGVCKCCGKTPTGRALHVDHDHTIASLKIPVVKLIKPEGSIWLWRATVEQFDIVLESCVSLQDARDGARQLLLALSVRGLVCWACNQMLKCSRNNPSILRSGAQYLDDYREKLQCNSIKTLA